MNKKFKNFLMLFACVGLSACAHSRESSGNYPESESVVALEEIVEESTENNAYEEVAAEEITESESKEVAKMEFGNWTLNDDSHYISPYIREEYEKGGPIRFIYYYCCPIKIVHVKIAWLDCRYNAVESFFAEIQAR